MLYKEAEAQFNRCRDKNVGAKIDNNTCLCKRGYAFAVKLHDTDVVIIRPNGTYRLYSGWYRTPVTKRRINSILPNGIVSQTKGLWHFGPNDTGAFFREGMLIDSCGKVIGNRKPMNEVLPILKGVTEKCNKFVRYAIEACGRRDIQPWKTHNSRVIPRITSSTHITHLWDAILRENNHMGFARWCHLAIVSRNFRDPQRIWEKARHICLGNYGGSPVLKESLQKFVDLHKPMIVDKMVSGAITPVYPQNTKLNLDTFNPATSCVSM